MHFFLFYFSNRHTRGTHVRFPNPIFIEKSTNPGNTSRVCPFENQPNMSDDKSKTSSVNDNILDLLDDVDFMNSLED